MEQGFQHKEKYACGLVFENAKSFLDNATVVIDRMVMGKQGRRVFAPVRKLANERVYLLRYLVFNLKVPQSLRNINEQK